MTKLNLNCVVRCDNPMMNIIFVHGLSGDPYDTWRNESTDVYWPNLLGEDYDNISVYSFEYPTNLFNIGPDKKLDMFEIASIALEKFVINNIENKPIVFIAHSLGGILVKLILRNASESNDEKYKNIVSSTKLVMFIGTPHKGIEFLNFKKIFDFGSNQIKTLENKFGFLNNLNDFYRNLTLQQKNLATRAYYEKHTYKKIIVVNRESADPGITTTPVPVNKNHKDICKPSDQNDFVYESTKRHIQTLFDNLENNTNWGNDYSKRSDEDPRNLLKKLIDVNREHEYEFANGCQNKFARIYMQEGLLDAAREEHEILLSKIQTRFNLYVYLRLICKSASEQEILDAVMKDVIESLDGEVINNNTVKADWILNAYYFLAEQCYIKWDNK